MTKLVELKKAMNNAADAYACAAANTANDTAYAAYDKARHAYVKARDAYNKELNKG